MDTCTVLLSTVLSDSIATSGDTVCQIGYRDDNLWGKLPPLFTQSMKYLPILLMKTSNMSSTRSPYACILRAIIWGDTLKTQRIHLHELTKNIELDDRGYLYNTTTAYYSETPLASFDFRPTPGLTERGTGNTIAGCMGEKNGST